MNGHHVKKGEEIGLFQFGGSSILVAFEKGRIQFDEDLESLSCQQIMTDVEVGESLGQASKHFASTSHK
jgi:phosphatidylserine decarboxylase